MKENKVRKPNGFYSEMSKRKLIEYVEKNYDRNTIREFAKRNSGCYDIARKRGLIDKLVEERILIRTMKRPGFFRNMSNDELIDYSKREHSGKKIIQLERSDSACHRHLNMRGLVDKLVDDGMLIRQVKKN